MSPVTLDAIALLLLCAVGIAWLSDLALLFRGATWASTALPRTVGEVCGVVLALSVLGVL